MANAGVRGLAGGGCIRSVSSMNSAAFSSYSATVMPTFSQNLDLLMCTAVTSKTFQPARSLK